MCVARGVSLGAARLAVGSSKSSLPPSCGF